MLQDLFQLEKETQKIQCDTEKNRLNKTIFEVATLSECMLEPECLSICQKKGVFLQQYEVLRNCQNNHDLLTEDEVAVIRMYLGKDIHSRVNRQLRESDKNPIDKDVIEYSRLLNLALDKLPSFDNQIVYRDIQRPVEVSQLLNFYDVTEEYKELAFMSTHIEEGCWGEVQLIIHTKNNSNGKFLGTLNPIENEVLFKTNTLLKVISVNRDLQKIELEEI